MIPSSSPVPFPRRGGPVTFNEYLARNEKVRRPPCCDVWLNMMPTFCSTSAPLLVMDHRTRRFRKLGSRLNFEPLEAGDRLGLGEGELLGKIGGAFDFPDSPLGGVPAESVYTSRPHGPGHFRRSPLSSPSRYPQTRLAAQQRCESGPPIDGRARGCPIDRM